MEVQASQVPRSPRYYRGEAPPPPPVIPVPPPPEKLTPVIIVDEAGRPRRQLTAGGVFWAVLFALICWTLIIWLVLGAALENSSSNGF